MQVATQILVSPDPDDRPSTTPSQTPSSSIPQHTANLLARPLLRNNPPSGGTFPTSGPNGGNPGGGGGPGGGNPAQPPAHGPAGPVVPANQHDLEPIGALPAVFDDSDYPRADDFLNQIKNYFRANKHVASFDSPVCKIAFTMTLVKGPKVAGWARDIGERLDTLDPADNIPEIWEQFLQEFRTKYQYTQREEHTQTKSQRFRMKFPYIDQYISEFEEFARQAGYVRGDQAVTRLFLNGLPASILRDVVRPPTPHTYEEFKQKAIDITRALQLVEDILGQSTNTGRFQPNRRINWGHLNQPQGRPRRPFFPQGGQQQQLPARPYLQQPYDSSNAPRNMANALVPMDLDCACAPNRQGEGRGSQRFNATATRAQQRRRNNNCFECGRPGHFARDCPQRKSSQSISTN